MSHRDSCRKLAGSAFELQMQPGCRGTMRRRFPRRDELSLLQLCRHFRLGDVVDASATAAPCRFGQLGQLEAGNGIENFPWLFCDLLPVAQMTSLVVCDGKFLES